MSKSKFIHTLSESNNTFALEQKAIVVSFVKYVAFLLGHPVVVKGQIDWLKYFCILVASLGC